jgi:hypothetical protein
MDNETEKCSEIVFNKATVNDVALRRRKISKSVMTEEEKYKNRKGIITL